MKFVNLFKYWSVILAIIPLCVYSAKDTIKWQPEKILVDGNLSDWGNLLNLYDTDMKLFYSLRNDSHNLYMAIKCQDEFMQMKIMQAGISFSFSIKSKPKINASIIFPKIDNENIKIGDERSDSKMDMKAFMKENYLLNNNTADVYGFKMSKDFIPLNNSNTEHITYCIKWDNSNALIYEFRIPFQEFYGKGYTFNDILKNLAQLSIEIEGMETPSMPTGEMGAPPSGGQMPGGMSGPPPGGKGGGMPGGPPGGGTGGSAGSMPANNMGTSIFQKQSLRYKFFIARKK